MGWEKLQSVIIPMLVLIFPLDKNNNLKGVKSLFRHLICCILQTNCVQETIYMTNQVRYGHVFTCWPSCALNSFIERISYLVILFKISTYIFTRLTYGNLPRNMWYTTNPFRVQGQGQNGNLFFFTEYFPISLRIERFITIC